MRQETKKKKRQITGQKTLRIKTPKSTRPRRAKFANFSTSDKRAFAAQLRRAPTTSERVLRDWLRREKINFQFQPLLHGYIPDFYFPAQRLIIELDGKCHKGREQYDRFRDKILRGKRLKVKHIKSKRIFSDFVRVKVEILCWLKNQPVPPRNLTQKVK